MTNKIVTLNLESLSTKELINIKLDLIASEGFTEADKIFLTEVNLELIKRNSK